MQKCRVTGETFSRLAFTFAPGFAFDAGVNHGVSRAREWLQRADTLEEAGRLNDALTWFHKTNAIDAEEFTDAAERAESLEKRVDRNE